MKPNIRKVTVTVIVSFTWLLFLIFIAYAFMLQPTLDHPAELNPQAASKPVSTPTADNRVKFSSECNIKFKTPPANRTHKYTVVGNKIEFFWDYVSISSNDIPGFSHLLSISLQTKGGESVGDFSPGYMNIFCSVNPEKLTAQQLFEREERSIPLKYPATNNPLAGKVEKIGPAVLDKVEGLEVKYTIPGIQTPIRDFLITTENHIYRISYTSGVNIPAVVEDMEDVVASIEFLD